MACKCSLITLSEVTLQGRYGIWTIYTNSQKKTVNLLGSMSVSLAMKKSLESALTWAWIYPHSQEQTCNGIRKESHWGANPPFTPPYKVVCELSCWKENSDAYAGVSDLSASSYHCGHLSMRSLSLPRKKSANCLVFHSCSKKRISWVFTEVTVQSGLWLRT